MNPKLKDALVSFLRVWVLGTLALWIPGLLGWINDVTAWARHQGATPFPDAHGLAFLFVAAITSAFVAAMAGAVRFLENVTGKTVLPRAAGPQTVPPAAPPGEGGAAAPGLLTIIGVVVLILLLVVLLR